MQQCAFLFLGTQGWLWTWWETLKTSTQKHQRPAVQSRERLADFVWGDGLTVSCTQVYQQLQGGSLPDFFCELMSLNLTLWEDLCIMSLWYLENFTGERKKVPVNPKACQYRCWFDPWIRNIPWRSKWQPTPVCVSEKSHGQRSLADSGPWGHKSQTRLNYYHHVKSQKDFLETCIGILRPMQIDIKGHDLSVLHKVLRPLTRNIISLYKCTFSHQLVISKFLLKKKKKKENETLFRHQFQMGVLTPRGNCNGVLRRF